MFRVVFWDKLPCKMIVDRRFRGAYCLHHHTRRRENLKSHRVCALFLSSKVGCLGDKFNLYLHFKFLWLYINHRNNPLLPWEQNEKAKHEPACWVKSRIPSSCWVELRVKIDSRYRPHDANDRPCMAACRVMNAATMTSALSFLARHFPLFIVHFISFPRFSIGFTYVCE
jgi:hypothetical protein